MPVVIDIFPRDKETGYWGDITRTVVRGRASEKIRRMHRDVLAAQKLALAMIRPGVEVARRAAGRREHSSAQPAMKRAFRRRARNAASSTAWAMASASTSTKSPGLRNESGRLAPATSSPSSPASMFPDLGGVRIEDTVVVTRTGHKMLATFPKNLEL